MEAEKRLKISPGQEAQPDSDAEGQPLWLPVPCQGDGWSRNLPAGLMVDSGRVCNHLLDVSETPLELFGLRLSKRFVPELKEQERLCLWTES